MNMEMFIDKLKNSGYEPVQSGTAGVYTFRHKAGNHIIGVMQCTDMDVIAGHKLESLRGNLSVVYGTANVLFVIFTDDPYRVNQFIEADSGHWIYNYTESRLVIYENQPGTFFGAEKLFEPERARTRQNYVFTVNNFIILVNVIVFAVMALKGNTQNTYYLYKCGGITPESLFEDHQIYRLFTSMFMHSGISHLVNNMIVLYFIGGTLEKYVGRVRYLIIYLLSGLLGGLISQIYYMAMSENVICVGASGAIFGAVGAMLTVVVVNHGRVENFTLPRLIIYVVLSIYLGFTSPGVSLSAHLGGLAIGFFTALLLYRKRGSYS